MTKAKMITMNKKNNPSAGLIGLETLREYCQPFITPQAKEFYQELRPINAIDEGAITIFGEIGDRWTQEIQGTCNTAYALLSALNQASPNPVTVVINSPGGDMFEGVAMYNLLKQYPGEVTVKVVGLAASAASIIAMGGDKVYMSKASILMIHNVWGLVVGNKEALRDMVDVFETYDDMLAGIFSDKTNLEKSAILEMMEDESYFNAESALDQKFIDGVIEDSDKGGEEAPREAKNLWAKLDKQFARLGVPRTQRREMYKDIKDEIGKLAGDNGTQDATSPVSNDKGKQDATNIVPLPEPLPRLTFDFKFNAGE